MTCWSDIKREAKIAKWCKVPGPKPPAQPPRKRPPEPQEPPQWAEPAEAEFEEPEQTVKEPAKPRLGRPGPGPGLGQSKSTKSKPKSKPSKPTPPARSAQKPLRPARPAPKRKLEPPEPEPQQPEPDWQEEPAEPETWEEPEKWEEAEEETWQPAKPAKPARQPRCDLPWTCFRCCYVLLFLAFQNVICTFTWTQVHHVNTNPRPSKKCHETVHAKHDNNAWCRRLIKRLFSAGRQAQRHQAILQHDQVPGTVDLGEI